MTERITRQHRETLDHNERPPDPAEAADRPLERKERDQADPGPVHEPGAGVPPKHDHDPHHALNRPVGEPDETADSDPYGD
jgi:hypothetical protein